MNRMIHHKEIRKVNVNGNMKGHTPVVDIKALMFHRIVNDKDLAQKYLFCLHVSEFRRHIEWLDRHGYTAITLEDYRLYCDGQLVLPRRPIILSFDDGYLDTYETAFPLLNEFGMKGVVFVLGDRSIRENTWDGKFNGSAAPLLENHHILEMAESGMEIGSHSLTHLKLTTLNQESAWNEIWRSRILLEILLNRPVRSFSYPFGFMNETLKRLVRDAGYIHACSVWSGPRLFGADSFEIRRIPIYNSSTTMSLAIKLTSPFQYYSWIRSKMKSLLETNDQNHLDGPISPPSIPIKVPSIYQENGYE